MAAKGKHYAWSDLYHGGKTEKRSRANGQEMTIVLERNVIHRGDEVTQAKLDVSDDEWDALVKSGSVRPYPLPEGADAYTSPTRAMLKSLVDDKGDIDPNKLMELGLAHPPVSNPPADEAVPAGV